MSHPQDLLPLPLPSSPASPHLLQGFHPSVQLFLNQWVTQGLRHPAPISPRPRPHVLLPLVDLPPPAHLHLTTHLHLTILGWVALLTLLRLVALPQAAITTIGQAALHQEDITIIQPAVLRPADLTLLRLAVLHQEDITTTPPAVPRPAGITLLLPAVLRPADLILIRPAAIHQADTTTLQPQQQSTEESQSLSR